MSTKELVTQDLSALNPEEIEQVADFMRFLKFRSRVSAARTPEGQDEARLAALYGEFTEEDRALAEEGMADYARGLEQEDVK